MMDRTVVVSWRSLWVAEVNALLEIDDEPDFCWYRAGDAYDPLGLNFARLGEPSAPTLGDFFDHECTHATVLQVDLIRPGIDVLELTYPNKGHSCLLDIDGIALPMLQQFGCGDNWLCLGTTTGNGSRISEAQRSLIFPDLRRFNRLKGCEYGSVLPSERLTHALEEYLQGWLPKKMAFYHWDELGPCADKPGDPG